MKCKSRIMWLDILKIIACFLVIIDHTGGYIFYHSQSNGTIIYYCLNLAICKIAVPIFIMTTGLLLLKKQSSYSEIMKKVLKIFVPLIMLSFVLYVKDNNLNILLFLRSFVNGPIISPYWYLYMLISLYLITPLIQKMLKNFNDRDYIYLFIICLFIPLLLNTICTLFNFKFTSLIYICLFPKIISIYILGYYLSNNVLKRKYKNIAIIIFTTSIILFFLTLYIPYILKGKVSEIFNTYDSLFAVGGAGSLFYIIRYYFSDRKINLKISNIIRKVSECTFGIYLFHYLIIYRIYNFNILQKIFDFNQYIGVLLLEIVVFILCGLFTYILRQIPCIKRYL